MLEVIGVAAIFLCVFLVLSKVIRSANAVHALTKGKPSQDSQSKTPAPAAVVDMTPPALQTNVEFRVGEKTEPKIDFAKLGEMTIEVDAKSSTDMSSQSAVPSPTKVSASSAKAFAVIDPRAWWFSVQGVKKSKAGRPMAVRSTSAARLAQAASLREQAIAAAKAAHKQDASRARKWQARLKKFRNTILEQASASDIEQLLEHSLRMEGVI